MSALRSLASLGESLLATAPTAEQETESYEDFFSRLHDSLDPEGACPDPLTLIDYTNQTRERLFEIREANWPHVDALSESE